MLLQSNTDLVSEAFTISCALVKQMYELIVLNQADMVLKGDKMSLRLVNYIKNKFSDMSLTVKIRFYFIIILLIFCFAFSLMFYKQFEYNKEFNQIVKNATAASSFSIDFKKDLEYKMNQIIFNDKPFDDVMADIDEAESIAEVLINTARSKECQTRAVNIERYLKNLRTHVLEVKANIDSDGLYDDRIKILENKIYITTELIHNTIMEYTYYITIELEDFRTGMHSSMIKSFELTAIIVGVIAIGALFISLIISESISKPIKQLGMITNQVAKGDLSVRSDIQNGAEVKVLSDSLNIMIEKLSNLIETVKSEQTSLREAELRLLQEQINPHFLYNTLDTIIWLAETNKSETVIDMVSSLSAYFRSSLSKGKNIVTLNDEITHVRSYLSIQKLRYGDILEYEINIPDELTYCRVPKITLQPLVENALYHGIKNKRGKGRIEIRGIFKDNSLILSIEDNGLGMKPDRLKQVIEGIYDNDENNKNFFGLYNVNKRIQLYYGTEFGIRMESIYGEGARVEVVIPFSTDKEATATQNANDFVMLQNGGCNK